MIIAMEPKGKRQLMVTPPATAQWPRHSIRHPGEIASPSPAHHLECCRITQCNAGNRGVEFH
jgi:hypothetical protein